MKKVFLTLITATASTMALAQSGQSATNDAMLLIYIVGGAMLVLLILVAAVAINVIRVLKVLTEEAARADLHKTQATSKPAMSRLKQWWDKINASVPVEQEKDIELDHSYDGIRELDNHLPPWWKALFYGTIAFAFVYMVVYHVTDSLPLSADEYKRELARAEEQIRKYQASQPRAVIDENTLEYTADPEAIEKGKAIYTSNNCGGCHRHDGGGNMIGPNLTDEYWLHGGDIKSIFSTIKNGVVEKGMPAWGKAMSPQDVRDVTFFVMSLQGTQPPDAKGPQGERFIQANTPADSVVTKAGL